uniref:Harbinger n=1 Tax=Rhipicephalus appendiculatus TaxID=34631 RepID=A0A131YKB8_RHIAP
MHHPAYVPSIFPAEYHHSTPYDSTGAVERYNRWSARFRPGAPSAAVTCTERGQNPDTQLFPQTQGQQVSNGEGMLMQCLDTADNDRPHQAEPVDLADGECDRHKKVPAACTSSALPCPPLTRQDVGCETDPAPTVLASSNLVDRAVGPNTRACYFGGYDTISSTAGAIRNLCGVDDNVFSLLLSLLPHVRDKASDVNLQNKLIIFLLKLKHGLPFSAIAVLFGIHETTASRIFFMVLGTLACATRRWIFKPPLHVIRDTMPECFKVNYPECTLVVDCTEIRTETPSEVRQQHVLFSTYKNGFTLKYLVAIAPSGFIVFKSKSFGGRCSDTQIVLDSGFLDIVETGDVILADKGFPGIQAGVAGRNAVLIMPPFSVGKQQFSEQQLNTTYNIAQVRIHVERVIQRIKTHGILQHRIPVSLIPAMSDIFHMCCVLANLQRPVIENNEN